MLIMKFGGTSVKDAIAMQQVLDIVKMKLDKHPIIVLSACSGITDKLINLIKLSVNNKEQSLTILKEIKSHHLKLISDLILNTEFKTIAINKINSLILDLKTLTEGVSLIGECSARSIDSAASFGEILSSTIFHSVLLDNNIDAEFLDIRNIIKTDSNFNCAKVNFDKTDENKHIVLDMLNNHNVVVTQGFIASNENKVTTVLGRGGSDYSASILGSAINAEDIEIWTDVSGIMSADPRLVPNAKTVNQMTYGEVQELSFYEAKVLHPDTIKPSINKNIPVHVLNTFEPQGSGTIIVKDTDTNYPQINAITLKSNCVMLTISVSSKDVLLGFIKNLIDSDIKIYGQYIQNNICIIIVNNHENITCIIEEYNEFLKFNINSISILCFSGVNLSGIANNIGKLLEQLTHLISKYNPIGFYSGFNDNSLIALLPNNFDTNELKIIHNNIFKQV